MAWLFPSWPLNGGFLFQLVIIIYKKDLHISPKTTFIVLQGNGALVVHVIKISASFQPFYTTHQVSALQIDPNSHFRGKLELSLRKFIYISHNFTAQVVSTKCVPSNFKSAQLLDHLRCLVSSKLDKCDCNHHIQVFDKFWASFERNWSFILSSVLFNKSGLPGL